MGPRRVAGIIAVILTFQLAQVAAAGETAPSVRVPFGAGPVERSVGAVTVVEGDHLWKIASDHLEHRFGASSKPETVARYWRAVIELNRDGLRSGDPDLIYPGEVIRLPDFEINESP